MCVSRVGHIYGTELKVCDDPFCPTLDKLAGCLYNWLFNPDLCGDWELLQHVAFCQEQSMWSLFWCCVLGQARARAFPVSPPHPREAGAGTLALLLSTVGLALLVSFPLRLPAFLHSSKTNPPPPLSFPNKTSHWLCKYEIIGKMELAGLSQSVLGKK